MTQILLLSLLATLWVAREEAARPSVEVPMPPPALEGEMSVEETLERRRSRRSWRSKKLDLGQLSQLLWAAQGITDDQGHRTAPSAGALYPIELLVVVGAVEGLEPGIYRYRPRGHRLRLLVAGDLRAELVREARAQRWIDEAPVILAVTSVVERSAARYGRRAQRYAEIEAGCVAQNVYLQATALELGTVLVGAFSDAGLHEALRLEPGEQPLLLLPVGRP